MARQEITVSEAHRYRAINLLTEDGKCINYHSGGPEVVLATSFDRVNAERDAALGREAALIEKIATIRAERDDRIKFRNMRCDELQQSLTAADEREDVLKGQVSMLLRELQELINDEDGILVAAELSTGFAWHSLQKHGKAIKATLKAAEGRGHD